jgi:hypothetical protein
MWQPRRRFWLSAEAQSECVAERCASRSLLTDPFRTRQVEYAGEVASYFKDKKTVTLVHSGDGLIGEPFRPKLGNGLQSQLEKLGVKVILGERVEGLQGRTSGLLRGEQTFETKNHGQIKGQSGPSKPLGRTT